MARTSKLLPGFERIPGTGKNERFRNTVTGAEYSRRKYDEIRRPGFTNETLARLNKVTAPVQAVLRPARGRTSALKTAGEFRESVAESRIAEQKRIEETKKLAREEADKFRRIERFKGRKVKVKKLTARLLRPGKLGTRIGFNDYDEYLALMDDLERMGDRKVVAYGLGFAAVDIRLGLERDVTVFPMHSIHDTFDEDEFDSEMETELDNRPYLQFLNYFMHVAFAVPFAKEKAAAAGRKIHKQTLAKRG